MTAAAGLSHPSELGPHHLVRRVSLTEIRLFSQLHIFLEDGELLSGTHDRDFYSAAWKLSQATACYDTGPGRGAELSADTELGASADGPAGPRGVLALVRQAHAWERNEEVRQSYHRMADAP